MCVIYDTFNPRTVPDVTVKSSLACRFFRVEIWVGGGRRVSFKCREERRKKKKKKRKMPRLAFGSALPGDGQLSLSPHIEMLAYQCWYVWRKWNENKEME